MSEPYKACSQFSARTCQWTKVADLLQDRSRFAAVHLDKYIYMYEFVVHVSFVHCRVIYAFSLGGFAGFKRVARMYNDTIDRYSIEHDRWESFFFNGPQLSSLAACAYKNSIFFGGGKNALW
jgi:hypothetical protein